MKGSSSNNPNLPVADDYDDGNGTNTLFYQMKSKANKTTRIDFSNTSNNGIYVTTNTDNGVPVYYYRGNVSNRIIFANFCWRIVRTTETGGVKLMYDGIPTDGKCSNTKNDTSIGSSAFNSSHNSLSSVGYMYGKVYNRKNQSMSSLTESIVFGNDVTYDVNTDTYSLVDTYVLTEPSDWSTEYKTITGKYHYTCFTSSDTCEKVNYINYIYNYSTGNADLSYYELSGGKNHLDILKEMLDNSTNENDSTAKAAIDTWYQNNMTSYTSQLEDTVFCNDRTYDISQTGWNKDYSNNSADNGNGYMYFGAYQRLISNKQPSLVCPSVNDKFTVNSSNGNGALTYPVGLLTADEVAYAGGVYNQRNYYYYLNSSIAFRLLSPCLFGSGTSEFLVKLYGEISEEYNYYSYNLRPVISLKPGTAISSGSGTAANPYIVG